MELQPPRSRSSFQADVRRIERCHRAPGRVDAIAVDAIESELGDIRKTAVLAEHDTVRTRTGLCCTQRVAGVLVSVKPLAQPAVLLDAVGSGRTAVVSDRDRDRDLAARIEHDLIRPIAVRAHLVEQRTIGSINLGPSRG